MTTWDAYEKRVREADPDGALSFDEAENYVSLIYPMVVRREELGLSVDDLAERAGLSATTIRRVEGSGYNPTFKTLIKIAGALGLILTVKEWPS